MYLTPRAPFGAATLIDEDLSVDFSGATSNSDAVTSIATKPLTRDERWATLEKGALVVFREGEIFSGRGPRRTSSAAGAGVATMVESVGAAARIRQLRRGLPS